MWLPSSLFGVIFCGEDLCDHGGSSYRLWEMEKTKVRNPWGITNGILRQYWCGTLWGEYVKISASCVFIGYRGLSGVYPVGVVLCVTQSLHSFLALSLVGSIAIHCIPLPAGTTYSSLLLFVVTVFSVLCTTGVFHEGGVMCCKF